MEKDKHRLFLLDILRVLCALQIYMYHSIGMYGCTYGPTMDNIICYLTGPVMTCFFILSGFSIHYQHRIEVISADWVRTYLKKRLIAILPSYLLVALIWPLAFPEQLREWTLLLPVDLFGVQTTYHTLFGITHNGGTWFVSCLLLAYILYPVIKAVFASKRRWVPVIILVIGHGLLMYSYVVIDRFGVADIYSNPITRAAEFMVGVAFAEVLFRERSTSAAHGSEGGTGKNRGKGHSGKNWGAGAFLRRTVTMVGTPVGTGVVLTLVTAVISFVAARLNWISQPELILTIYLPIPVVLLILLIGSYLRCRPLEKSRVLSALSGMSYQFFLMQLFLWKLTDLVLGLFGWERNLARIGVSFTLCFVCSFLVWRFYDRPLRGWLKRKLIKQDA